MIRIENTRAALLHLPHNIKLQEKNGKQDNAMTIGENVSLVPGGNNVDDKEWAAVKDHHVVKMWLEAGYIKVGGDTKAPEGPKTPESLGGYSEAGAVAIVESEEGQDNLKMWKKAEKREGVIKAIDAKLKGGK